MRNDIAAQLRADGRRLGAARRQVIDALEERAAAVTAEELAVALPGVHVSSVYRSLAVLEELGIVRHVHLGHGPALWELTHEADDARHLVCERCGRHVVVPAEVFRELEARLADQHGFVIDRGHFALTGRCTACTEA
jgi:Fur family ferric uptake transcriptional regulator